MSNKSYDLTDNLVRGILDGGPGRGSPQKMKRLTSELTTEGLIEINFSRPAGFNRRESVIIPLTGERIHTTLSLSTFFSHTIDENTPLVGGANLLRLSYRDWCKLQILRAKKLFIDAWKSAIVWNVFKCSVAYFIASFAVYWTPFNELLGKSDSKHVVATVAVYFHPARSQGSMIQTLIFVVVSLLFSFGVSFGCRMIAAFVYLQGQDEISHVLDLIFSSVSLGVIAFMKQKVNLQTFNTACSLAYITIVTSIVKEGSQNSALIPIERLLAHFWIVLLGCLTSVLVCYLIAPENAVHELRKSLNDSYNTISSVLSLVSYKFLVGERITGTKENDIFNKLKKHQADLSKRLGEAKYQLLLVGNEKEWYTLKELVESTVTSMEILSALKCSYEMEVQVLNENSNNNSGNGNDDNGSVASFDSYHSSSYSLSQSVENMTAIDYGNTESATNPSELFDMFVYHLGPSMKSFIFTMKGILAQVPFEKRRDDDPYKFIETGQFQDSLNQAMDLYKIKQNQALGTLYEQKIFGSNEDWNFLTAQEEVAAICGNFSSLLVSFAGELMDFLKITEQYDDKRRSPRSWDWLKMWFNKTFNPSGRLARRREAAAKIASYGSTLNAAIFDLQEQIRSQQIKKPNLPKDNFVQRFRVKTYTMFRFLSRRDIQFGIRVGLGAFIMSSFAFWPPTKEIFIQWRLEWALTVYCIMMNKSLGGTNMTVKWRFLGTFMGSFLAYAVWTLTDGNPYALALSGFIISLYSFYIIIYWKKNNPFGRFILLTYNLTALYSYSMVQKDTEDGREGGENPIVGEIAFHRFISVSIGIVFALTMATFFLPNSARRRLKLALSVLWLRMGVNWNCDPFEYDPCSKKLVGIRDEKEMNNLLRECETLVKQAPLEFRWKGPFRLSEYEKLVKSTSNILSSFKNLDLIVQVDPNLSPGEEHVLDLTESDRHEIQQRIFLIFYMVTSALKLGFPLPNKPASTEHALDRMLVKLNNIRRMTESILTTDDYVLLYSYILVTNAITNELDIIIKVIKDIYGGISEELFELV
ncbi:uncharacterized protein KQ657_003327 [Scheffersomyces spartinae]|uniref:DUF2421 domain-containing protein n=1 Tax=Scheffersomyces spartinae TaxID=45513 RepID=A0A9P7VD00_9ASCO|nr:uncharacterized protein KQ657_003327 [Scheffersomyces spartinae]KAG7195560.1 hypothetical protein KQ657_003327 [Scheffersomyces spartinae]